jgi:biotin carboxyl carrier protein
MVIRLNKGGNEHHPVIAKPIAGGYHVEYKGETYELKSDWKLGESLFNGTCNGVPFTLQVERHKTKYSLFHWGTRADFMVMSARAAELLSLMPEKLPPDLSKFLLSPMPGLLREVAVTVGQDVKAGEKLAVIEAMKMENILKAEQDCKVKKISLLPARVCRWTRSSSSSNKQHSGHTAHSPARCGLNGSFDGEGDPSFGAGSCRGSGVVLGRPLFFAAASRCR